MDSQTISLVRNHLLASLPPDALASLLPKLTPVEMPGRKLIFSADSLMDAAYFPETGMISLVTSLDDGIQAEVGVIGAEGMLGVSLMAGVDTAFTESVVQLPGHALRIGARELRQELDGNPALRLLLLRYSEALQSQIMQTAACNNHHGLEQRLARWLLMARDRADSDELPLTQEFMAMMLGVHRPSVTVTAGILQRAGLIRYAGGRITLLDRASLEASACECYGAVRRRFTKLLGAKVS